MTISLVLVTGILLASREALTRYKRHLVGSLVRMFITLGAPLSAIRMNPARTPASTFAPAHAKRLDHFSDPDCNSWVRQERGYRGVCSNVDNQPEGSFSSIAAKRS